MFDNINKSKISFEKYLNIKSKLIVKNYHEKFKLIDRFLYIFSWFGNMVSIFLAFFFLQTLFYSSFKIDSNILIIVGIVFFLTLFELLKRYVFGLFSVEFIKQKFKLFNKGMISFIISTLLLISGSFYLTLNGAKDFIDNEKIFEKETISVISIKNDSIINFHESKKTIFINENIKLKNYNNELRDRISSSNVKDMIKYQIIIDKNNRIIDTNNNEISKIDNKKNIETTNIKKQETNILTSSLDKNKTNIIAFIIISTIIELIIMIGIYYHKLYNYKIIEEYEETILNTIEFKMWFKYNNILELIYSSTKSIGEKIPTTDSLIELLKISNIQITKFEFDRFIKLLYNLEIIIKDGSRRVLNKSESEGKSLLRLYFKIK